MNKTYVRRGYTAEEKLENFEYAMTMFKRKVKKSGILNEVKKREYYVKPGIKRRLKQEAAAKARRSK